MEGCNGVTCDFTQNRTKEHLLYHAKQKIATIIDYVDRGLMPRRRDFLDKNLLAETSRMIQAGEPISFIPCDAQEPMTYDSYGNHTYKPYLFGILPCGTKCAVILEDVKVFFDVKLPSFPKKEDFEPMLDINKINADFIDDVRSICANSSINITNCEVIQLLPADEFSLTTHPYARFYFNDLADRKKCYDIIKSRENPPPTSSDDTGKGNKMYYLPKVAREHKFAMADWNTITNYKLVTGKTTCEYTFAVNVENFRAMSPEQRELAKTGIFSRAYDFDETIIAQWDIETKGELPDFKQNGRRYNLNRFSTDKYEIFMINMSYYAHWNTKSHIDVCCVDHVINVDRSKCREKTEKNTLITIVCGNDKNVLSAFIHVMGRMSPDLTSAFNGGGFDWPMCREKMHTYKQLGDLKRAMHSIIEAPKYYAEENVYKYSFETNKPVKLSATNDHIVVCMPRFAGIVDTDVMLNFLKLYPRAEIPKAASLNFFLADNKLSSKEDMPYKKMFRIHDRACELRRSIKSCHCDKRVECIGCESDIPEIDHIENDAVDGDHPDRYNGALHADIIDKCCFCGKRERNLQDMELVAIYCKVDCQRPQELNNKRGVIGDKRALATISYVPLINTFYLADGEKVRNMMAAYCYDYGVAFSNVTLEKGDHEKDHNVGGHVVPPKRGRYMVPVTGLDFESLYPSLMAAYNYSPDMIVTDPEFAKLLEKLGYTLHKITDESGTHLEYNRGTEKNHPSNQVFKSVTWTVRHNGILTKDDTRTITGYDENYAPIYGRNALPRERMGYMAYIVKSLKELRLPIKAALGKYASEIEILEKQIADASADQLDDLHDKLSTASFMKMSVTSKSNSIKVLANTFYGQVSSFRNSFYNINIAGGITSSGRKNLKMIKKVVEELGFFVAYGDTDSLYICCPDNVYDEARAKYGAGTTECYTEMVYVAMRVMKKLSADVFRHLVDDNKTLFLRMAYEEVGLPTVLCGRKKYYMIAHENIVNFRPKEIFVRGIEVKKQGQTKVNRDLQMGFMWESLDLSSTKELIDLGVEHIKRFFELAPNAADFSKMQTYKANKKNISVQSFIKRMRDTGMFVPDDGDKFRTVVVHKQQEFGIRGNLIPQSVGDKREYLHEFTRVAGTPNQMALDMDYYLAAGVYGAFAQFISYHPDFQQLGVDMTDSDQYTIAAAYSVNKANAFLKEICAPYLQKNRAADRRVGSAMRKEFNLAAKVIVGATEYNSVISRALYGSGLARKADEKSPALYIDKMMANMRADHTNSFAERFVADYRRDDIFALKRKYNAGVKERVIVLSRMQDEVITKLLREMPLVWEIRDKHKDVVAKCVANLTPLEEISQADQDKIQAVDAFTAKLRSIIFCKMNLTAISRVIEQEAIKIADIEYTPRLNARELARVESKLAIPMVEYKWQ